MIDIKIESRIFPALIDMYTGLKTFNHISEFRPEFDTRLIKFGMGRATGHTSAAVELIKYFNKSRVIYVAMQTNLQSMKRRLIESGVDTSKVHLCSRDPGNYLRGSVGNHIVIFDHHNQLECLKLQDELRAMHNYIIDRPRNDIYYFILQ